MLNRVGSKHRCDAVVPGGGRNLVPERITSLPPLDGGKDVILPTASTSSTTMKTGAAALPLPSERLSPRDM